MTILFSCLSCPCFPNRLGTVDIAWGWIMRTNETAGRRDIGGGAPPQLKDRDPLELFGSLANVEGICVLPKGSK